MEKKRIIEILEALASGASPATGEMLPPESVLNEVEVIRALQAVIHVMKNEPAAKVTKGRKKLEKPYAEIDYFRTEKFNNLTQSAIELIQERIKSYGILKNENLPQNIVKARILYPRAYENWSIPEKELLQEALKLTNDLEILSEYFQRGKGSIETEGQKLVYNSQQVESEV